MEAKVTNRPLEQVIAAINALDLESVKIRVTDPALGEGWTREYAQGIEQGYRNYLLMLAKYQDHAEDLLLSRDVDEFWHTHILQTIKYTDDCEAIFGKYLHHAPHVGEVTSADVEKRTAQAEKTRRLYKSEYGSEQDAAWAGIFVRPQTRPASDTGVQMENAAMSGAAIRMQDAAMSGAAIRVNDSAGAVAVAA